MTVNALGQNENSKLYTVVKATAVGAAAGYASKYILPVTKQEKNISLRSMLAYSRKVTNRAKVDEFEKSGVKTKAQNLFVKMINSKEKDAFKFDNVVRKVKALGGENSIAGKEFRSIIREVDEVSKSMSKRFVKAYNIMLKDIRPAAPFIVAGAGIGFFAGFAHNVMKTDFNA